MKEKKDEIRLYVKSEEDSQGIKEIAWNLWEHFWIKNS